MPDHVEVIDLQKSTVSKATWSILKLINTEKPAVVISMITHLNAVVGLLSPLYRSKPKVILRETNVLSKLFGGQLSIKRSVRKRLTQLGYSLSDTIMCQSHFMAKDVQETLNIKPGKCIVVNNPVAQYSVSNTEDTFDLIALGNLNPIKGYDRLMEIMLRLKETKLNLGIIGDGPERGFIEKKIVEYKLENQVTLLGFQKNPHTYLSGAKMLVMTSIMESFSNAVLEAGILGIPTVTYNMPGGMSEIISNGVNGYIVPDGDINLFCKAVIRLLKVPIDRSQIVDHTQRNYSLDTIMSQLEEMIL